MNKPIVVAVQLERLLDYSPEQAAYVVRAIDAHEELLAVVKDIVEMWKGNQSINQSALIGNSDDPIGYRAVQAIAKAEGK